MRVPVSLPSRDVITLSSATAIYFAIVVAFWAVAGNFGLAARLGHMPSLVAAFALMFAPYWFFGFGLANFLSAKLTTSPGRILTPALLGIPYVVYSLPRAEFRLGFFYIFVFIPVGTSALFELLPPQRQQSLSWQDVIGLALVALPIEFHWLDKAFPHPGLGSFAKLLLMDSTLYAFLVVRRVQNAGYDFRPKWMDAAVGLRELCFFAPIVITVGLLLHFIRPHGGLPSFATASTALLVTFFFVAIPEELFFRGLLMNLFESTIGRTAALWSSAVIFGLSHFNKPGPFNWQYVLLASIAGIFYGRAWRTRRRLLASATTHTAVDVLWSLWFR